MFKKLLSFVRSNLISKAIAYKTSLICAGVVLSFIGGMAYAIQASSEKANTATASSPKPVSTELVTSSSTLEETASLNQAPQTGTSNAASATTPKTSGRPAPNTPTSDAYDISLSTYAITVEAGKQSQSITATTSDGRKVAWMVVVPTGSRLFSNGIFGAPVSAYNFNMGTGVNGALGTYNVEVKAYIPSKSPKYVTKLLKVTVVQAKTFEVTFPTWVMARTSDTEAVVTYQLERKNGHTAPISVRALISSCMSGVSVGRITPLNANSGYVFLDVTPPVTAGICRVHVIGDDGSYSAAKYIDVQFVDY